MRRLDALKNQCPKMSGNPEDADQPLDDAAEVYEAYRKQIEHEDDLIGLRIGWFIAAEALLFAAYGVVLAVQQSGTIKGTVPIDRRVFTAVPILGMAMALLVGSGVAAAMHNIAVLWEPYKCKSLSRPDRYPPLRATNTLVNLGHLPAAALPGLMIICWGFMWKGWPGLWWTIGSVLVLVPVFYGVHEWRLKKAVVKVRGDHNMNGHMTHYAGTDWSHYALEKRQDNGLSKDTAP
jgi:hypothetical protein